MARWLAVLALMLTPLAAAADPAADFSGAWKIDGKFASVGISYSVTCTLTEDGGKLSGPCKEDQGGGTPQAAGAVDGAKVELAYDTTFQGSPIHLDYKGALQDDGSLKGVVDAGVAKGAFVAARQ